MYGDCIVTSKSTNDFSIILRIFSNGYANNRSDDPINFGDCTTCSANTIPACAGNPINALTGNKFQKEIDIQQINTATLGFQRYYNSKVSEEANLGVGWRHTYDRKLIKGVAPYNKSIANLNAYRPDGKIETYYQSSEEWLSAHTTSRIVPLFDEHENQKGWKYIDSEDTGEIYDVNGRLNEIIERSGLSTLLTYNTDNQLTKVTGPFGHTLIFSYDTEGRTSTITDNGGRVYTYLYDANNNLLSVLHPDSSSRQYHYDNTYTFQFLNNLTGITDENGSRYATFAYDPQDRAIASEHAGQAGRITIDFSAPDNPKITEALGTTTGYSYISLLALRKVTQSTFGSHFSYDTRGFITSKTDPNGMVTTFTRDSRGLELTRIEAVGTPQERTVTTSWHATYRLPLTITEPGRTTTFAYDDNGNLLTKTIAGGGLTRTWTFTYSDKGQMLTATDPRGKTTTYTYNTQGGVATITNPLGHTTHFTSYDANGRLLSLTDANGLVTTLTYDLRGRLTSLTSGGRTTIYAYDPVGNLTRVTRPDGSFLALTYDPAHRLIAMADALGNRIAFTLDAMGNRVKEEVFGNANQLTRTRQSTYDQLNRLATTIGAQNQRETFTYDNNGNLLAVTDPLNRVTSSGYDVLDRLIQVTDPAGGISTIAYNTHDQPTTVIDQRGLQTSYTYNALGDQTRLDSPDTGATTRTFGAAGNVLTATDARGQQTTFAYDDLGRLASQTFAGGSIAYQYDQGTNGIGRLTGMTDPSGSTAWNHDAHGRVVQKQQTVNGRTLTTAYQYDPATGRMTTMTYPSGKQLSFTYDAAGQVNGIKVDGTPLVSNITYQPFGAPASWSQGNGSIHTRTFDLDGRITGIATSGDAAETISLTHDAANRITRMSTTGGLPVTAPSGETTLHYGGNSNRLTSATGAMTKTYNYDAAGNTTSDGSTNLSYDGRGRLIQVVRNGQTTQYKINGLGQRVAKNSTNFVYDEQGHLLGEYDANGVAVQETIWLGNLPVGVMNFAGRFYINPDHLGAPHSITNSSGAMVWRWDHDPYGQMQPNQNPSHLGEFVYNLRFPGQYYDQETGLHYNYFRDYNPVVGRYIQSDPIGLAGGLNTYGYAGGKPNQQIDPYGLENDNSSSIDWKSFAKDSGELASQIATYIENSKVYHDMGDNINFLLRNTLSSVNKVNDAVDIILAFLNKNPQAGASAVSPLPGTDKIFENSKEIGSNLVNNPQVIRYTCENHHNQCNNLSNKNIKTSADKDFGYGNGLGVFHTIMDLFKN